MKEYKVITVGQLWTNKRLERKATEKINIYVQEGWQLGHIRHGWNAFLIPTLFVVLEREKTS